jgi:hypothetical protein
MNLIGKAIEIAVSAHSGQVDKAGQPYILHPLRMMLRLDGEAKRIVAVLQEGAGILDRRGAGRTKETWRADRLSINRPLILG